MANKRKFLLSNLFDNPGYLLQFLAYTNKPKIEAFSAIFAPNGFQKRTKKNIFIGLK